MRKLLITGASGFVGSALLQYSSRSFKVIGTKQHSNKHPNLIYLDLCNHDTTTAILEKHKPDYIIHLAANAYIDDCERNPETSVKINVEATKNLDDWALKNNAKFIFSSSDIVFNGEDAPYSEEATPSPINQYGLQKLAAEKAILCNNPNSVVCRLPLVIGPGGGHMAGLTNKLKKGQSQSLFIDEYRTPIYIDDLCHGLIQALEWPGGVYHLSGTESLNRLELGRLIAQQANLPLTMLLPSLQKEAEFFAPRPMNVSMKNDKARKLGFTPKKLSDRMHP